MDEELFPVPWPLLRWNAQYYKPQRLRNQVVQNRCCWAVDFKHHWSYSPLSLKRQEWANPGCWSLLATENRWGTKHIKWQDGLHWRRSSHLRARKTIVWGVKRLLYLEVRWDDFEQLPCRIHATCRSDSTARETQIQYLSDMGQNWPKDSVRVPGKSFTQVLKPALTSK